MQNVLVKEGDFVVKHQELGTVGTGNGQFSAHLHHDIPKKKLTPWTKYVTGMTKEQVCAAYDDPTPFIKTIFPKFSHYGYKYLDPIGGGKYHPGVDLNGPGAGNSDLGLPFYSPVNGRVVYCYSGGGSNGGWGKLLVIEEVNTAPVCNHQCPLHCV